MDTLVIFLLCFIICILIVIIMRLLSIRREYARIHDLTAEEARYEQAIADARATLSGITDECNTMATKYRELKKTVAVYEELDELLEYGHYEPHFDYVTSERYKLALKDNRDLQKQMLKNKTAIVCNTEWALSGSRSEGKKMSNRAVTLTARAFNGECDSLISKVKWNNVDRYTERIKKSFEKINNLNTSMDTTISERYLSLKIEELRLSHEYALKKHEEKEEQRRIREEIREEEKAKRDYERAVKEAAKEEKMLQEAMKKAREAMKHANEEQTLRYEARLQELTDLLHEAEAKNKRALSMAQQTKRGHVYIISNIGSFGENVYKIGMTRRLDPLDRINELGDASVPFKFDVHAMVFSDNAPELEAFLHQKFNHKRVNLINLRREYFDISIDDIEAVLYEYDDSIEVVRTAAADEYRESQQMRQGKSAVARDERDAIEDILKDLNF